MLAVWFFLFNVASRLVTDMFTSITDDITAKHKSRQEVFANQAAQEKQANEVAAQQVINGAALSRQQQQAFNAQYQAPDGCEVCNPCDEASHCLGTCGPNGTCQLGLAGDPCVGDQNCEYAPGGAGIFVCGDAGTCEREYRCTGYVTPCSLVSTYSCSSVAGCRTGGSCGGSPGSCYSQYSSYSCNSLDGCYWSSYSNNCSGSARSCSLYFSEYTCEGQGYCYWLPDCEGVAYSCGSFDAATCTTQPGCYLE